MAKKEDDSSWNFNTLDGKEKLEKDGSHHSYREWDHDKLMEHLRRETSGCGLGEDVFSALKGRRPTMSST